MSESLMFGEGSHPFVIFEPGILPFEKQVAQESHLMNAELTRNPAY